MYIHGMPVARRGWPAKGKCLAQPLKNMDGRQQYLCLSQVTVMLLYVEAAL